MASQVVLVIKNLPANAGDAGLIPGYGRSPGGGHGYPLQYSCLENPTDPEEPGGLQFPGSQRVWQEWSNLAHTRPRAGNEQYKLEILLIPKDRSTTGAPSKRVRGQLKEAPSGPKRDNFSISKNTVDWSPSDMSKSLKPTHWSLSQDADTNTLFLKTGQ